MNSPKRHSLPQAATTVPTHCLMHNAHLLCAQNRVSTTLKTVSTMEVLIFQKEAFEEMAAKFSRFSDRVNELLAKQDLRHAQPQFHEGHVPVLVLDGHLLLRHEGVDGEEPCKSRGRKPVDSYRTAEDRNARMCKADGDTARHLGEIQGHGCRREIAAHAYERKHEPPPQKDVGDVRHQPSDFIPSDPPLVRR